MVELGLNTTCGDKYFKPCLEALTNPLRELALTFPYGYMFDVENTLDLIEAVRDSPVLAKLERLKFKLHKKCDDDTPVEKLRELEELCKLKGIEFVPSVDQIVAGESLLFRVSEKWSLNCEKKDLATKWPGSHCELPGSVQATIAEVLCVTNPILPVDVRIYLTKKLILVENLDK